MKKLISVFVVVFAIFNQGFAAVERDHKPMIIFLNGASSSGKSSIVSALQKKLSPSLHVGIDHYFVMLPREYVFGGEHVADGFSLDIKDDEIGPIARIKAGPVASDLIFAMHRSIKALVDNGFPLIIDEVLIFDEAFQDYLQLLSDYRVYFIAVKPPLEVAMQREMDRGDRILGLARGSYDLVYLNKEFDLEIDSSLFSPEESAQIILKYIEEHPEPVSFQKNLK